MTYRGTGDLYLPACHLETRCGARWVERGYNPGRKIYRYCRNDRKSHREKRASK